METLSTSSSFVTTISNQTHFKTFFSTSNKVPIFTIKTNKKTLSLSTSQSPLTSSLFSSTNATPTCTPSNSTTFTSTDTHNHHWMVLMEEPPHGVNSKREIIDYYVKTLESVLGSVKDAQMCIYDVSTDTHFGFCCDIDEKTSVELAGVPGVLSVRPESDYNNAQKDYSSSVALSNSWNSQDGNLLLFPAGNTKHWLVKIDKPGVGVVTKAQMVDYYTQLLVKVLRNQKDAEMCIYHVSWQYDFGFCCELDEECAKELAGVPGVLSVQPDNNFESKNKDYGGSNVENSMDSLDSSQASSLTPIKAKKLFITGLSFYTSEKTLRAAFEGFGELVEVKIIMDKISKRSKGYAFVEYTTEEAASAALKEMNGKIINGWMIVVDVARSSPPKYGRRSPRT